jgi:hypothetical protein
MRKSLPPLQAKDTRLRLLRDSFAGQKCINDIPERRPSRGGGPE